MQGNCLWAEYTEQTAFAVKLAAKLLDSAFIPDSCIIIERLCLICIHKMLKLNHIIEE